MSVLGRFRKPGGFQQLLTLIETCEPSKQQNLLNLVGTEDPGWAHLVRLKTLTFARVLSWPVETLMEITPHLPDPILATAYQMAEQMAIHGPPLHEKWLQSLPSIKAREVRSLAQTAPFNIHEQIATGIKVIQVVRSLEFRGLLRFSKFDPTLEIDKRLTA